MGAHALGAAAYAVRAASIAEPNRPQAGDDEIRWQLAQLTAEVRAALRTLPPVGQNRSGPLGPGLLASGQLGTIVRDLQAGLSSQASTDPAAGRTSRGSRVSRRAR
ncbi:putative immunity protein [Flexivirga caeni]|uniref:putative immunity protein n=1 Tax=Flexivirga caeni TaxID=2294115 RepID=UPI00319DB5B7